MFDMFTELAKDDPHPDIDRPGLACAICMSEGRPATVYKPECRGWA